MIGAVTAGCAATQATAVLTGWAVEGSRFGYRAMDSGLPNTWPPFQVVLEVGSKHLRPDGIEDIWRPSAFLKDTAIVDTPGTNAVLRHHEQLTGEFIPRSDFILFVTSADRPFTESERIFLELIRDWGKKVLIVLNKVDLLEDRDEKVQAFLKAFGEIGPSAAAAASISRLSMSAMDQRRS